MHIKNIVATDILSALADRNRLRIMRTLAFLPEADVCLCELSDAFDEPAYSISRYLKELRSVGLLDAEKEGRWIYHRISDESALAPFYQLLKALPDPDGELKKDLSRVRAEIKRRGSARCKKEGPRRERKPNRQARSA